MLWMLPHPWFFYKWLFRRTLVADGSFTADHMKIRCPEEDVNLTHGHGYVVEECRYKQHLSDAQEFTDVPSLRPSISPRGPPAIITRQSMLSIPIRTIWSQMYRCMFFRVQAQLCLSDPSSGQPTSLGPPGRSIMSLDGWVHPRKIYQMWLMCAYSHYLIY